MRKCYPVWVFADRVKLVFIRALKAILHFSAYYGHWCLCHDSDSIRKPESTTERTDRRHYNQQLIKAFCMKIHQCQQGGQRDEKYYLRYEMFLLNTQIEVKLCCFCFPIYILIRLSKDMQGGDEQRLRKLFQYSSGSSILTKVYRALWCGRRWWIDLQS